VLLVSLSQAVVITELRFELRLENYMKPKKTTLIVLFHSIAWAILMIVLSFYFKGTVHSESLLIYMIGGWFVSDSLIKCVFGINQQNTCERNLLSKLFSSNQP
jgi:hypothetical protein